MCVYYTILSAVSIPNIPTIDRERIVIIILIVAVILL